ncbi:OmpP1/FadL family transporter [Acidobacteriota bacterium]
MAKKTLILLIILIVLSGSQQLRATGFSVFEIGARAAAMAGAYVAHVDDVSAIYYNPAGLAFLDGVRIKTNVLFSILRTTASHNTFGNYESKLLQLRGAHFLAWNLFDRFSIGIGIFNPYIAETSWMEDNPYSYNTKFNIYTIRPALALKLLKGLSIGFGVDIAFATLSWAHSLEWYEGIYGPYHARSRYEVNGNGMGYVVGILWKVGKMFHFGGRYQHKVSPNLAGLNFFRGVYDYPVSNVTGSITMPSELVLGLKFAPLDNLVLCLDFQKVRWSQTKGWKYQYDETQEHWGQGFYEIWEEFLNFSQEESRKSAVLRFKDTWTLKFGLEYSLNDKFALRAGYAHHPSAVSDGATHLIYPDLDRKIITFGFGYEGPLFSIWKSDTSMSELSLDLFLQYVMTEAQTSSIPGYEFTFDNDHFVIGLGLGFNF